MTAVDPASTGLRFTETMRGFVAPGQLDPAEGYRVGQRLGTALTVELTIQIDDIDRFLDDGGHLASASGWVDWQPGVQRRAIEHGAFNLFSAGRPGREMRYLLQFADGAGNPLTLLGWKEVRDDPGLDLWLDTTTLRTLVLEGHVDGERVTAEQIQAAGIIEISPVDFLRQLITFRARPEVAARFGAFFAGELWRRYGNPVRPGRAAPPVTPPPAKRPLQRPVARHGTPRRTELEREEVEFTTDDGRDLHLVHVNGPWPATRGPVLLVHGAGVRSDIFEAPVPTTLVDVLVEQGYDVWLENWRGSIAVDPSGWNLDEAARYDHPKAVRTILDKTGYDQLKAIVHCQGSTSFVMSAAAGLLPEVTTVVTNAVSLHPVVPAFSRVKIDLFRPIIARFTDHMDPHWGVHAPNPTAKAITLLARLFHHECRNTVCKLVSFTYGYGYPALWSHDNLNDQTHDWLREEFGRAPMTFFAQMAECVRRGHMVSVAGLDGLPGSYVDRAPETDARFVFLAGLRNRCFLPESQGRTWEFFDHYRPGYDRLYVLPRYGHLDVFMGQRAAVDVFPIILEELNRTPH
jgi:alpha/beta hydrolase fold